MTKIYTRINSNKTKQSFSLFFPLISMKEYFGSLYKFVLKNWFTITVDALCVFWKFNENSSESKILWILMINNLFMCGYIKFYDNFNYLHNKSWGNSHYNWCKFIAAWHYTYTHNMYGINIYIHINTWVHLRNYL